MLPSVQPPSPAAPPAASAPDATQLSADAIARVRPQVREMLTNIPAFGEMSAEEQGNLANNMVKVLAFMDDPNSIVSEAMAGDPLAAAMVGPQKKPDANEQTRQNLSKSPGFAGKDFEAGAARQGTDQFVRLVQEVDFPAFVGGLINNVFQTIVSSSIEQMRAYAELVANVAKSASDYMNENIGLGQGRDYLADRFPDLLRVEPGEEGQSRLVPTGEDPEAGIAEIYKTMGIPGEPITDLDDENQEMQLVNAARLAMAKSRQQLLASMVMLGINRIVVTDGSITAKVKFDMRATDEAKRDYRASASDKQTMRNRNTTAFGGTFLGFGGGSVNVNERGHVATVKTSVDESSESKLDLTAKLQGEVRVNFKSDYLPLEKMATPEMIGAIQGNAQPVSPAGTAGTAATAGA
ncbi:MAG: hypothetical protein U0S50_10870 [Sphingopyxis sp.]|uniref:hypothetical protein n=1 Tax=Sphingopyxis sp. TaxID=1908224 RepID=UPI002AB92661|nr:hypothetical protein [Sphingopyxis sp.]MDZ3832308.1 hypothetical protein [Sphingopyxis sp.]